MANGGVQSLARFILSPLLVISRLLLSLTILLGGRELAWAAEPATAAKASPTMVLVVEGGSPKLRNAIIGEVPEPWARADGKAIAASAKKRELPDSLKDIEGTTTKGPYLTRLGRVTEDVGAKAAVAVLVTTKGKARQAHVIIVTATGSVKLDKEVPLKAAADEDAAIIAKAFSTELGALAGQDAEAPAKTEPTAPAATPAANASSTEAPKPTASGSGSGSGSTSSSSSGEAATPPIKPVDNGPEPPPLLVATVGMELANRQLSYRDPVTRLRSDDSGITPTPAISADFYPGARTGTSVLQDIGVFGDFKLGIAKDKSVPEGRSASVSWTRFDIGLKYRIWLTRREWKAPMIAPSISYGREAYSFDRLDPPPEPLETPAANYETLRPRIEGRLPLGPIAILGGAGFLAILSSGEVGGKFRDTTVIGWEADLALAIPLPFIGKPFEARLGFGYRRYIYWFSPIAGDPYVANGAHDQMMRGGIDLAAHL
jgi:hypothetical protein